MNKNTNVVVIDGRYQLVDLIGQGGMGYVYRALEMRTLDMVAVKQLLPHIIARDPDILTRFVREAEALNTLNHPNIVKLIDYVEQDGEHYLIMELATGGSLEDVLQKQPRLSIRRSLEISLELADALTRAHHLKIIHRDLKPANILLSDDGTPLLADFGIARVSGSNITETGTTLGTLNYLSPEAVNGEQLDGRADIWAFGVILFQMVTGTLPFQADSMIALMYAIATQELPHIADIQAEIPAELAELIENMLHKEREDRISTVRRVAAEIEDILLNLDQDDITPSEDKIKTISDLSPTTLPSPAPEWCEIPAGNVQISNRAFTVTPFKLAKYPVTVAQYERFIEDSGYSTIEYWTLAGWQWREEKEIIHPRLWGEGQHYSENFPVGGVSWHEAIAYCTWLTQQLDLPSNLLIRLPTEWEWQWAAQGGDNREYTWGNNFDPDRANTDESRIGGFTPVDRYAQGISPFGVYDMCGNAWEWVLNAFDPPFDTELNTTGQRVLRGGAWYWHKVVAKVTYRGSKKVNARNLNYGFRVCWAEPVNPQSL